jgi:molybdopterin-guanine dinucleotide biosynthesis protein A
MGQDKALVALDGRPLIAHALAVLQQAGLGARIAGGRAELAEFAPVVEEFAPDRGPLGGICAALAATEARRAVFLPVDLPLLPASLVVFLLECARTTGRAITVPSVNGFAQSFPAVVDREALPGLSSELEAGRGGCFAAFEAAAGRLGETVAVAPVEAAVQSGHVAHAQGLAAARWFLNVNRPEDIVRAEARLRAMHRVS